MFRYVIVGAVVSASALVVPAAAAPLHAAHECSGGADASSQPVHGQRTPRAALKHYLRHPPMRGFITSGYWRVDKLSTSKRVVFRAQRRLHHDEVDVDRNRDRSWTADGYTDCR